MKLRGLPLENEICTRVVALRVLAAHPWITPF
jgi:hypothetical protein